MGSFTDVFLESFEMLRAGFLQRVAIGDHGILNDIVVHQIITKIFKLFQVSQALFDTEKRTVKTIRMLINVNDLKHELLNFLLFN